MKTTALIKFFSSITSLSGSCEDALENLAVSETYRSHQVIHAAGQTENRFWFITKGAARQYYLEPSGREHTLSFYLENDPIWSNQGYWHEAADHYIEVLEPSVMLAISYRAFDLLAADLPEAGQLVQALIRRQYHLELNKTRLLDLPAEERYRQVRKNQPALFRRVSVRLIASYLNMTRENLSRLMSKDL